MVEASRLFKRGSPLRLTAETFAVLGGAVVGGAILGYVGAEFGQIFGDHVGPSLLPHWPIGISEGTVGGFLGLIGAAGGGVAAGKVAGIK